ncbi:hypothetical protein BJ741DRAFT_605030 [Chytriomyces cf. hyalinus JEL632]|nr:hypothetical protein BJ741DRAFT_605030 [Chytriomyces cf. hyalinus JEL632]
MGDRYWQAVDPGVLDENLSCIICHEVLHEPRMLSTCRHMYCHTCIRQWVAQKGTCPICRQAAQMDQLSAQKVEPYIGDAANWITRLDGTRFQTRQELLQVVIACSYPGCGFVGRMMDHECPQYECCFSLNGCPIKSMDRDSAADHARMCRYTVAPVRNDSEDSSWVPVIIAGTVIAGCFLFLPLRAAITVVSVGVGIVAVMSEQEMREKRSNKSLAI